MRLYDPAERKEKKTQEMVNSIHAKIEKEYEGFDYLTAEREFLMGKEGKIQKAKKSSIAVICIVLAILTVVTVLAVNSLNSEAEPPPAITDELPLKDFSPKPDTTSETPGEVKQSEKTEDTPKPTKTPEPTKDSPPETSPGSVASATVEPARTVPVRTETYKSQPDAVNSGAKYGTLYCPATGLDAPLVLGTPAVGSVGQDEVSLQIGYVGLHILNANAVSGVSNLSAGNVFVVETAYGKYVYKVASSDVGYAEYGTGAIMKSDGTALISAIITDDVIYLITDHSTDGQVQYKSIITAMLVL